MIPDRPIVLLGEFTTGKAPASPYLARHGWGRMWVTKGPHFDYDGEPYGLDNGAFSCWRKGKGFDDGAFLRRLDAALETGVKPVLAIVPDIVAGGLESLEFSLAWRDRLPDSLPWYLAVQDGMTPDDIAQDIHRFDGLFLGGTDRFKRTALTWRAWTEERGIPMHWGRCGTANKLREAIAIGVDSVDSVTPVLKIGEGRKHLMDRFERTWLGTCPQQELFT